MVRIAHEEGKMVSRYSFGTDGLVHERKETHQEVRTGPDGIERTFLFQWEPVNFGDGDLIDRWIIEWWSEKAKRKQSFFATFETLDEALQYLDEHLPRIT
jgi:hypothetical protein